MTPGDDAVRVPSRDLILAAALQAFDERGFGSTSMSDIRRATGVSTGSLYHHFPSKRHLAAALFVDGIESYQREFLATVLGVGGAEAGIRAGVHFHVSWARGDRARSRLLLGMMDRDLSPAATLDLADQTRSFVRSVHRWLTSYVQAGELRSLPRDLYYPVWIGPAQELVRQWLAGRMKTAMGPAVEHLSDSACRALRA